MTDRFRVTYWSISVVPGYGCGMMRAITSWRLTPQDAVDEAEAKGWRQGNPLIWAINRARANEDLKGWRHPAPVLQGLQIERSPWPPHPSGVQVIGRWMRRDRGWVAAVVAGVTVGWAIGWVAAAALMHWVLHR